MGFKLLNIDGQAALAKGEEFFFVKKASNGSLSGDLMKLLGHSGELVSLNGRLSGRTADGKLIDAKPGPPIPAPPKVFAVGMNYREHTQNAGYKVSEEPLVFTKFPSCLSGASSDITLHGDKCDYEAELVVVIGEGGKNIPEAAAWDAVFGMTIGQDISDRRLQFICDPPQFSLAKSFDGFGPIGPWVMPVRDIENPDDLGIVTKVNGEVRQDDRTSSMIFSVPQIISYLSNITTLHRGDLIFTGTPLGTGLATGKYLQEGDLIETSIEQIGFMSNRCVAATSE